MGQKTSVKLKSHYSISPEAVFRDVAGEEVILDLQSGTYFGLNKTGTEIWNLIQQEKSVESIASFLGEEYGIPEKIALEDAQKLVSELLKKKLLIAA